MNLERPHVRDSHAVYTSDHVLDLWVDPDRTVVRKDEDELELAVDQGVFDPDTAAAIEADCESFFGDPIVPVHYAAATPEAAVHESILHEAVPHAHVPRASWVRKVLTPLRTTRQFRLVQLHSAGHRRLGVHARGVTDTDSDQYAYTVEWALSAHAAGTDGVAWMSRQLNSVRA